MENAQRINGKYLKHGKFDFHCDTQIVLENISNQWLNESIKNMLDVAGHLTR